MENRMYDVYNHYGIPNNVPFDQVASPNTVQQSGGVGSMGYSDLQILQATYGVPWHSVDVVNKTAKPHPQPQPDISRQYRELRCRRSRTRKA
jgi:hypothetical protein